MSNSSEVVPSGRPRSAEADQAIYEACIQLLSEEGFPSTTIDAVANLSGVSRPSIYRRFADRNDLIESCVEKLLSTDLPTVTPTSNPMRDVVALLENTCHMLTQTLMGGIIRCVMPYLTKHQRVAEHFVSVGNRRRVALRQALLRAIEDGMIDEPTNVDVLIDALIGAIYTRFLMTNHLNRSYARKLVKELTNW